MARPLRIQAAGLTYHITGRGVRRMNIFLDDDDRRRFLNVLAEVVEQYALRCHAYCEMTNHYHLAITTTDANLSRALQQLNRDYAQWWNRRHQHVGHVFQARFHGQVVQDDVYLLNVCRYIVLNPVRAGMVATPEQWPWSSYAAMVGLVSVPCWLSCDPVLALVSPEAPLEGAHRFRQFVLESDALAMRLGRDAILGDDAFVARFQPYRANASREVPGRDGRRSLEAIFGGAVTRAARDAAILTAWQERHTQAAIARYLEVHPSTVQKVVWRQGARSRKAHGF